MYMHVLTLSGSYEIYDIETHQMVADTQDYNTQYPRKYRHLALNKDSTLAMIATDRDVRLLNVKDKTWPRVLDDYFPKSGQIVSLQWHPTNPKLIAAASKNGDIELITL